MKRIILVLIAIFSLNVVAYASFPVAESSVEQISTFNSISSVISDGPAVWGVLSFSFSVIGVILFFTPVFGTGVLLHVLAIIFGAIGFNKDLKGLAISGFVLSLLALLFGLLFLVIIIASGGGMGGAFGG